MRISILAAAILVLQCFAASAYSQAANPGQAKDIAIVQKLGTKVPLDLEFKDETGKDVKLRQYFKNDRPVVLIPVFYGCQGVCGLIRVNSVRTMGDLKTLLVGKDYDVLVLSVHPKETPQMAANAKPLWLQEYRYKDTDAGWHFLTGSMTNIKALTQAVGFKFRYYPESNRINHPATLIVMTPDGRPSHYLEGNSYSPAELRDSIRLASQNAVGDEVPTILVGCWQYDPKTGKYRIVVENVLKVLGISTALILFASIAFMSVKYRQKPLHPLSDSKGQAGGEN
jgi:protein SCO1/2